jgi:outer membrane protein OmpA-like peptidoglycan-associated protein
MVKAGLSRQGTRCVSRSAAARSDDPPPPSEPPATKFTELRTLLVGPEQRQLRALQTRLEDPAAQARDVSRVLAAAVELRTNDPHLKRALAPTIEETISASVRRNPRPLADALFPIIGPAIRKAVATTLSGMLESLNTTLELSLSWRSLQWRLDARRTGKSFAEIVLLNTLVYRVEQVFLIHRPSGLLLQHLMAPGVPAQDPDLVSAMLTAIRDFVGDSFKVREDEGLQTLKVGELSVWVEQGPHALLAVVVRGTAPPALRATLQQALESVHAQYSDLLESFDGNAARFEGARSLLEVCLQQQYRGRKRRARLSPTAQALTVLTLLALGTWMFFALRARSRWNGYVSALRSEPGIVVVSSGREGGRFVVSGLRDPLARDPATLLGPNHIAADDVVGRWELYQALHPTLVIARARQLLAPPAEVNLQLQKDVLVAAGTAPIDWIDTSLRMAPVIPGVTRLDASSLIASSVDALARSIEAAIPMFIKGSTEFTPGGEQIVRAQLARLTSLDALGRVAKRQFTVELVGEADADGPPELNLPLSERRAARVLSMLQAQSLDHVTFTAIGVGSREGPDPAAGEEKKQRNRRVSFRITSADRR